MSAVILVTDGTERAALAIVRSLGRAGYRVHVCADRKWALAGCSRYASASHRLPAALTDPAGFAEGVISLTHGIEADLVIPVTEASLRALLPERGSLAPAELPFPSAETFCRVSDKETLREVAERLGIRTPRQVSIPAAEALSGESGRLPSFPLVLKPTRSVVPTGDGGQQKVGVSYAADPRELAARLAAYPSQAFPLQLQERIVGPGLGVFLLRWEGKILAAFSHRRIREKPPSGGVSVYRESVPVDPELLAASTRLLESFDWQGVAMVEFKRDTGSGQTYLMEVNGRFWGSLQLAIDAGVDFPRLLVEAALGGDPDPVHGYRTGIRSRWWWGDVDHLLARLRGSTASLSLPDGSSGRARALLDFAHLWRPGDRYEVFRLSDPGPFVSETREWLRSAFGDRSEGDGRTLGESAA